MFQINIIISLEKFQSKSEDEIIDDKTENEDEIIAPSKEAINNIQKDSINPYEITKKEIEQQLHNELHAFGVDPLWKKIPKNSFKKIMNVLNHHQQMSKKVNQIKILYSFVVYQF